MQARIPVKNFVINGLIQSLYIFKYSNLVANYLVIQADPFLILMKVISFCFITIENLHVLIWHVVN